MHLFPSRAGEKTYSISLSRGFSLAFLSSIYILGFIITPYWILGNSTTHTVLYLTITLGIGLIWVLLSANSLQVELTLKDGWLFILLLAGIIALNYRALNSVIPFRGDEGLHIDRTLEVVNRIPAGQSLLALILFALFIYSAVRNRGRTIFVGVVLITAALLFFLRSNPFEDVLETPKFFLRYPFINYWLFAALPKLASLVASPYHEALYRMIPVLSMIGVAWVFQKKSGVTGFPGNIAWGLAIAIMPLVFYYSSILYIEPPAVFLMTVACLDINNLLHKNNREISQNASWYALILIGFVKETAIPFLLCFIAFRFFVQLQTWSKRTVEEKQRERLANLLAGELGIIFSVLAPALLYLYFRSALASARGYAPQILNLFDFTIYRFVILSFVEQFGAFLLFFIGGCILFIVNREFTSLLCYISLILVTLTFHVMDSKAYIGYSRFNLLILPPILAVSIRLVSWAAKQKHYIGSILVFTAIAGNLLISPINWDGTKAPYWGNYLIDASEHYYPYQDALLWLRDNQKDERMLFTGLDYPYSFQFYWNKLSWHPRRDGLTTQDKGDETVAVTRILEQAERERFDVVVYRVLGRDFIPPRETGNFQAKIIRNDAHTLIIYYKKP